MGEMSCIALEELEDAEFGSTIVEHNMGRNLPGSKSDKGTYQSTSKKTK